MIMKLIHSSKAQPGGPQRAETSPSSSGHSCRPEGRDALQFTPRLPLAPSVGGGPMPDGTSQTTAPGGVPCI